jgi:CheY-like chemotaxis protein
MPKSQQLFILIAEDDADDSAIIRLCFENHPAFTKIVIVDNGRELVDFLRNAEPRPDIILTDINMPMVNGIEALMAINNDNSLNTIIRFVYSTTINPVYRAKCIKFGAIGFFIKPYNLKEFGLIPEKMLEIINGLPH